MESIRHSAFVAEPSGVPSSKYARRYHSPSQPSRSSAAFSALTCSRHVSARLCSPRASAILANSQRTVCRNQPSHTLSPLPSCPTRFMPSFQSPVPISGSPWLPTARLRSSARAQCSNSDARVSETARLEIRFALSLGQRIALQKRHDFIQHALSPVTSMNWMTA